MLYNNTYLIIADISERENWLLMSSDEASSILDEEEEGRDLLNDQTFRYTKCLQNKAPLAELIS